jgi:N-hydroxyarylamine O-acetyltransferase
MDTGSAVPFDLDAYLRRIGYAGDRAPTPGTLEALHLAHLRHIPFENLDIQLGRPVAVDLACVQAKLVGARRGGYCFEQNTLLAAALEALGFRVTLLMARVRRPGATHVAPRTHLVLRVEVDGGPWLADVGFGTGGLLKPLPLAAGRPSEQFFWTYRLTEGGGLWVLQTLDGGGAWQDVYAFTLEPHYPADVEMANHYTSTHPASRFLQTVTAQLSTPEARYALRGREFMVERGPDLRTRTLGDEELLAVLADTFGLHFPPGTRFRSLAVG